MNPANSKSYNPPKPSFKSPKLVQESLHITSASQDLSRVAHPFASFRCAPPPPEQHFQQSISPPRVPNRPRIPSISEFGSFHSSHDYAELIKLQASQEAQNLEAAPHGRARSSTVGSQHSFAPDYRPVDDFLPSPNPIKSQFEDSDDEEKLDFAHHSLAGVSTRARLAAIGTASRLFKSKRHSRTPSSSVGVKVNSHERMESFQLDKRNNHVRDSSACRPNTSDGMSPNPRQAVFGHRPSPSEISLLSKRESSRSIAPADRDLILGLQGGTPKLRKPTEKKKSLPKPPDHSPPSHFRQASVNSSSSSTDVNMHWADPPPYRSPTESELIRGENLRKSQSLSTLRFGFNRRPGSTSPATEAAGPRASEHVSPPAHQQVEQSAWEAMLTLSPSTAGDHGSASSCTRTTRSEAIHTSPGKRTLKSHRLPPQKPPPQSCLPPPPPAQQPAVNKTNADATKSSFETYASCPSSTGDSSGGGSVQNHDRNKTLEFAISVKTSLDGSNRVDNSSSPQSSPPQVSKPLVSQVRTLEQNSQVELDIGGTKFVTLVSTLQGAPDDQPRLLDLLQRQQVDSNASTEPALCRQGVECELGGAASKSNISLSTSRSGSVSHGESEASIRRTSDTSNASSWSKHTSEADDELLKQQAVPDASDWTTALPSSRLCSPTHFPPSPLSPVPSKLTPAPSPHSIFIDRNGDLYRDILDILRTRKLPYRLQASCLVNSGDDRSGMAALKLQLRCRLFEVKDEAEWLGYSSIVGMCEGEIARV